MQCRDDAPTPSTPVLPAGSALIEPPVRALSSTGRDRHLGEHGWSHAEGVEVPAAQGQGGDVEGSPVLDPPHEGGGFGHRTGEVDQRAVPDRVPAPGEVAVFEPAVVTERLPVSRPGAIGCAGRVGGIEPRMTDRALEGMPAYALYPEATRRAFEDMPYLLIWQASKPS